MIEDDKVRDVYEVFKSKFPNMGMFMLVFDPYKPNTEALHCCNVKPNELVIAQLREVIRLLDKSPNQK